MSKAKSNIKKPSSPRQLPTVNNISGRDLGQKEVGEVDIQEESALQKSSLEMLGLR